MRRKRWLLTATHVPPSGAGGGMVRYCVEVARALGSRSDIELHILCASPTAQFFRELLDQPTRIHSVGSMPVALRSALERQGSTLFPRLGPFDVVHSAKHLVPNHCDGAMKLMTVHDMLPLDRPSDFGTLKRRFLRGPYLASVRTADRIVCVSEATRDRLCSYVPSASDKSVVVELGISSDLLAVSPHAVAVLRGRKYALVVGDPSPRKNLPLVIDMWPELVARHPEVFLAVVGPPSWGSAHLSAVARAPDKHVLLLGHLTNAELSWAYQNTFAVLCPSQLEGFGLPALEAAAFGIPVLTSEDAALCEISSPAAAHLSSRNPRVWLEALSQLLMSNGSFRCTESVRSWDLVAAETIAAVEHV